MYRETAGLVMYGQLGKDSILMKLGSLIEKRWKRNTNEKVGRSYGNGRN